MLNYRWSVSVRQRVARSRVRRPKSRSILGVEALEDRCLLAGTPIWIPEGPAPSQVDASLMQNIGVSTGNPANPTSNPTTGDVNSIAVNPNNPNQLFAATADGGIWMTNNAYALAPSWTPLTDNLPSLAMGAIVFSPLDNNNQPVTTGTPSQNLVIYAGTGFFSNGSQSGSPVGVYKSSNDGASWSQIPGPFAASGLSINRIVPTTMIDSGTSPGRGGQIVFASVAALNDTSPPASQQGLYRSLDGGNTWTLLSGGTNPSGSSLTGGSSTGLPANIGVTDVAADPVNNMNLYAALVDNSTNVGKGVYASTDGGSTWTATAHIPNVATDGAGKINLAISKQNGQLTTSNTAVTTTGVPTTITPASMQGISAGLTLVVDTGASQESVTVSSVTATTFTATFTKTHAVGFAIAAYRPVYVGLVNFYKTSNGDSHGDLKAVFVSMNMGQTWTALANAPNVDDGDHQGLNDFEILADPNNPNTVYIGGDIQTTYPIPDLGTTSYGGNHYQGVFNPATGATTWNSLDGFGALTFNLVSSVSTGSNTANTLNDNTQTWLASQWKNGTVQITGGTGAGQTNTIVSNTTTALTVGTNWTTMPDNTSTYTITFTGTSTPSTSSPNTATKLVDTTQAWTANQWTYAAIVITAGKGAGQKNTIVSNTGTTLTLNSKWTTVPDSTSKYQIGLGTSPHGDTHNWVFDANGNIIEGNDGGIYRLNNPNNPSTRYWSALNSSNTVRGRSTGTNTATTLNDTTQAWRANQWQNGVVQITGGAGAGQARTITSNTGSALTISTAWTTVPDATSTYVINQAIQAFEFNSISFDSVNNIIFGGSQDDGSPQQNTTGQPQSTDLTGADGELTQVFNQVQPGQPYQSIRYSSFYDFGAFQSQVFNGSNQPQTALVPINLNVQGTNGTYSGGYQGESQMSLGDDFDSLSDFTLYATNAIDPTRLLIGTSHLYESAFGASGTSSGSNTANTLNDTSQDWAASQWLNDTIQITGGTGAGQTGTITSNTATSITVSANWTTVPDATSTYVVSGYQGGNTIVSLGGITGTTSAGFAPQGSVGSVYAIAYGGMLNGSPNPNVAYVGTSANSGELLLRTTAPLTLSGTSSGSNTASTLNDTRQAWTTNQWQGGVIEITSGTGAGEQAAIASNTGTTLTISGTWATIPNATSTYAITPPAANSNGTSTPSTSIPNTSTTLVDTTQTWLTNQWQGGTIKITSGTGSGQTRTIASNTANTITVSTNWTTVPDNNSNYTITIGTGRPSGFTQLKTYTGQTPLDIVLDPSNWQSVYVLDWNNQVWYSPNAMTTAFANITGNLNLSPFVSNYNSLAWYKTSTGPVLFVGGLPNMLSGTSSGTNTANTLNDTTQKWTTNQWQNDTILITGGTGAGQTNTITSNTATTLNLSANWTTVPDSTSTYFIFASAGTGGVYVNTNPTPTFFNGTSSGTNTTNTLNDTTQNWQANQWQNGKVQITFGTGAGQVRTIASNTATTLTVSANWTTVPDSTSTYTITPSFSGTSTGSNTATTLNDTTRAWTANQWQNDTVQITGGTGAGQVRTITTNTATTLTVNAAWATVPDSTSTYVISTNWSSFGQQLPAVQVVDLVADPINNVLVAGTFGRGAWEVQNLSSFFANQPPVLNLNGPAGANFAATFTQGGGAVAIVGSTTLTVTDPDSPILQSAGIRITNVKDGSAEVLAANTGGTNISATYDSTSGLLTLTGSDTLANYQQVLRTVTYNDTAVRLNSTTRKIDFRVYDGTSNSAVVSTTLTMMAQPGNPVVQVGAPTVKYTADSGPTPIAVGTTVTFPGILTSGQVAITNRQDGTAELLGVTTAGTNITASYSATTGVLTLTGNDTAAAYQSVLSSLTYQDTTLVPHTATRIVSLTVDAGASKSPTAEIDVQIIPVNHAPVVLSTATFQMNPVSANTSDNSGTQVAALLKSVQPPDAITDVDPGAKLGIAVVGTDNSQGTWQFSIDFGTTWMGFLSPSVTQATLLTRAPQTSVRFVPIPGFAGVVASGLSFRIWDQSNKGEAGFNEPTVNGRIANTSDNGGSTPFSTAIVAATIVVNAAATSTTVTATPNPAMFGQTITFTATVQALSPASGTPTGTVTFTDNLIRIGGATLTNGSATLQLSTLSVGNHTIAALYDGSNSFSSSTSPSIMQVVNPAIPPTATVSVSSGQANPTTGSPILFTVTFSAPVTGFNSGGVTLGGTAAATTATVTGSGASYVVAVSGMAQAGTVTVSLPAGAAADSLGSPSQASNSASVSFQVNSVLGSTVLVAPSVPVGNQPIVPVVNSTTGAVEFTLIPFSPAFMGGVHTAVGWGLIVAGAGAGGGPDVKVYNSSGTLLFSFFPYNPAFTGGVNVAIGDLDGDGMPEVIVGAGAGGGADIKVYNGRTGALLKSFFAFDPAFSGGATVAAGDVNGDGADDIIVGAGPSGGPNVAVFNGKTHAVLASFFAFNSAFSGGVTVAAEDLNHDNRADIIVGAGPTGGPNVAAFNGATLQVLDSFFAYDLLSGGVRVAAGGMTSTGQAVIRTAHGTNTGQGLFTDFDALTQANLDTFFVFDANVQKFSRVAL